MTDHHNTTVDVVRSIVSYVAALLGIGTVAGLVNLGVGVLSGLWLAYQLWVAITIDLPIKRAKLAAVRAGKVPANTEPGELR